MRSRYYVLIGMLMLMFVGIVLNAQQAHADVIASQYDHSTQWGTTVPGTRNYIGWQGSYGCFTVASSSANFTGVSAYLFDNMTHSGTLGIDFWSSTNCTTGYAGHISFGSVSVPSGGGYVSGSSTQSLVGVRSFYVDGNADSGCGGSSCEGSIGYYGDAVGNPGVIAYDDGTTPPPPPTPTITQLISYTPADASIASSTSPITLAVQYWASSSPDIYPGLTAGHLQVTVDREDTGGNQIFASSTDTLTYGSTATWNATTTLTLPAGSYSEDWSLWDTTGQYVIAHNTLPIRFAVDQNPWPWLIGATSTNPADIKVLATSTCDYLHLQGCFQNALVWAFVPSAESLQNLSQAGDQIMLAPPVGYVTQYRLAFASTSASGTPPWVVPLPTSSALYLQLVQPLRTGVAAVLIMILCFSMYRQIRTPLDL